MTGYVRKDTSNNIADGNVINATDFDNEFDGLQDAFNSSTGHVHDGTTGNGAPILAVGPTQDVVASATALTPKTNNTVDVGSNSLKFKDLYMAGNASIGGTLVVTGVATLTAQPVLSSLTASQVVFTNGTKGLVSNAITGTGNVVMSAGPTLTGTIGAEAITASGAVTLSGGTANGVTYLNGSKVLTTGTALTFDGSTLGLGQYLGANGRLNITTASSATFQVGFYATNAVDTDFQIRFKTGISDIGTGTSTPLTFSIAGTEQMRLTSTGLGIGTSSPSTKLQLTGASQAGTSLTMLYSGVQAGSIGLNSSGSMIFGLDNSTGATTRVTISSAGNVGIGTSTPITLLSNTATAWAGGTATDGFAWRSTQNDWTATVLATPATGNGYGLRLHTLGTTASDYPLWISSGTSTGTVRAVMTGAGNFGIGMSSPAAALDVKSAINVTNPANVSLQALKGTSFGYSSAYSVVQVSNTATVSIGYDPSINANGSFSGDGSEVIFRNGVKFITPNAANNDWNLNSLVLKDGNVGIGTSSPSKRLDVSGDASFLGVTVGRGAGAVATNTAVGASALAANTTGTQLTAIGLRSLRSNTTGNSGTAVGAFALDANTTGAENVAVGLSSLVSNTTGASNTALGAYALAFNTTASNNTAVGYQAGYSNQTGAYQTFLGQQAGLGVTTGTQNTLVGYYSGGSLTTGSYNCFIGGAYGSGAGGLMTTGSKNSILGSYSGNQGGLDIRTANNYIVLSDGDGNPRVVVDGSGNMGVGATSLSNKLTVIGSAYFSDATTTDVQITTASSLSTIGCATNTPLAFKTNNTERARIDASGNLLVGITAVSDTPAHGVVIRDVSGTSGAVNVGHASGVVTGTAYMNFAYNGGGIGSITQNGTTGVLYNIMSDARLKTVKGAVSGHSERIDALLPVEYEWKADGAKARGFLAHQFQEVYPSSVTGSKDAVDDEGKPVYQAMQASTTEVIADLVAELQSLRARLAVLEAK